jgi:hypothetical protein
MPAAAVVSFVVPTLADDQVIIVRVPAAQRRGPGFAQRLAAFMAQDDTPSARLWRRDELIRQLAAGYDGSRKARAVDPLAVRPTLRLLPRRASRHPAGADVAPAEGGGAFPAPEAAAEYLADAIISSPNCT